MLLLCILLPLLNYVILTLFGRFMGKSGAGVISLFNMFISFLISLLLIKTVMFDSNFSYLSAYTWLNSKLLHVAWGFLFDSVTCSMLLIVTFISLCVHLFSLDYMSTDPHIIRFLSYLSLFTFFMLILVTADNFLQIFVGWEGVGLCSYLLINFWFTRAQANKSAIKALLVNKVGDICLMLGFLTIFIIFKTLKFNLLFMILPFFVKTVICILGFKVNVVFFISLLLFVGVVGKSAQIGLHSWLPDAMEGPTPVSALIHAATMVTAGVFLLVRCSKLLEYSSSSFFLIVMVFGSLTAVFAAITGLFQCDIKKIVAYSTCSQLGYMVLICGLSGYVAALFHVLTHAFFKALLFLASGAVIHALGDEQDIRKMGSIAKIYPLFYINFFIGSIALGGFPFLAGFFSKDFIIESAFSVFLVKGIIGSTLATLAAMFSALYSVRLIYTVFFNSPKSHKRALVNLDIMPLSFLLVLTVLSLLSIFAGYLLSDVFIGIGSDVFTGAIADFNVVVVDNEFLPLYVKVIPLVLSLTGTLLGFLWPVNFRSYLVNFYPWYKLWVTKFAFDYIYNCFLTNFVLRSSYQTVFKLLDKIYLEFFGPFTFIRFTLNIMRNFKTTQSFNTKQNVELILISFIHLGLLIYFIAS